jgi:hypothetical protein
MRVFLLILFITPAVLTVVLDLFCSDVRLGNNTVLGTCTPAFFESTYHALISFWTLSAISFFIPFGLIGVSLVVYNAMVILASIAVGCAAISSFVREGISTGAYKYNFSFLVLVILSFFSAVLHAKRLF